MSESSVIVTPEDVRDRIRGSYRNGRVYYIDGDPLPSVTTLIGSGEPKPALINWAKRSTAEAAVESHEVLSAIIAKDGPQAAIDYLKGSSNRQRNAAGDRGTTIHAIAESIALGNPLPDLKKGSELWTISRHLENLFETLTPKVVAVEAIVARPSVDGATGYGGTVDIAWSLPESLGFTVLGDDPDLPTLADFKSGSGIYSSTALQLSAYSRATHTIGKDGLQPMFPVNQDRAIGIHITPKGWRLIEVAIGQKVFEAFLSVAEVARWIDDTSDGVIGRTIATGGAVGGKAVSKKASEPEKSQPEPEKPKALRSLRGSIVKPGAQSEPEKPKAAPRVTKLNAPRLGRASD